MLWWELEQEQWGGFSSRSGSSGQHQQLEEQWQAAAAVAAVVGGGSGSWRRSGQPVAVAVAEASWAVAVLSSGMQWQQLEEQSH